MARCQATTKTGKQCGKSAKAGQWYCWLHGSESGRQRHRENARKGASARKEKYRKFKEDLADCPVAQDWDGCLDFVDAEMVRICREVDTAVSRSRLLATWMRLRIEALAHRDKAHGVGSEISVTVVDPGRGG
jgi:hypothetical protein